MKSSAACALFFFLLWPAALSASDAPASTIVSDALTEVEYLAFHSRPSMISRPLLRDLMQAFERPGLGAPVHWLILSASEEEAAELRRKLAVQGVADTDRRVSFLVSPFAYDTWPRDLYVFRANGVPGTYEILPLSPHEDSPGKEIAGRISEEASSIQSAGVSGNRLFPFAGGDVTSDDAFVYVGEKSVARMLENGWPDREAALEGIRQTFGREVIVLPGEDPHHDRYHMPLGVTRGQRTNLLADPLAALRMLREMSAGEKERVIRRYISNYTWHSAEEVRRELEALFSLDDEALRFYENTPYVKSLDAVARALEQRGIRVVRMPALHNRIAGERQLPLGLYYVNLVQDTYRDIDGRRVHRKAVVPAYGIEPLDRRAREILEGLGFEVRMVEAVREGYRGAGIHCLLQAAGAKISPVLTPKE